MTRDFNNVAFQLSGVLAGDVGSDASLAAAHAVMGIYVSAAQSRPIDYSVQHFRSTFAVPAKRALDDGAYRSDFERRASIFKHVPPGVTFEQVHGRRCGLKLKCDACGAPGDLASLKKCANCHQSFYCGPACQKAHWKTHKHVCADLVALSVASAPWHPSTRKLMCLACGFGPAPPADIARHCDLTGHAADGNASRTVRPAS